ncbi:MAG: hypothetical protein ACYC1Q_06340 [Bacteroidia bacterium]
MNPFLRARHWQIFALLFGLPLVIQAWWMGGLFSTFAKPGDDPEMADELFKWMLMEKIPVLVGAIAITVMLQLAWYFSVALGLRKYTPAGVRLRILPFVVSFVIPFMYSLLIGRFLYQLYRTDFSMPRWFHGGAVALLLLMHVMALACSFYVLYYTARAYKTALLKRKVARTEVVGEFFMVLFLFAGVWLLQPKISHIIEGEINPEEAEPENTDFSKYSN